VNVNGLYVKSGLRLGCFAALLLAVSAPALTEDAVFVPSFFDPQARPVKPGLEGVRSLRFLTEDDYPPFHFALPDGHLSGFDVDLARAVCEELAISCTIQARRFDTLIEALNEDQGDAIIAALRVDTTSRAKLDFSKPYYTLPARFVSTIALQHASATPESLRGKAVGVQAHSAHEAYLETFFPETVRKPYETQELMRDALISGAIDMAFGDGISLSLWLTSPSGQSCCRFRGGPFLDPNFFGEGVGIAVKKGNLQLRQALDYALAALAHHGTYTTLYLKYFPVGFY